MDAVTRLTMFGVPPWCHAVNKSDSDTIIMVIVLVAGVGAVFILFALMALCYR